MIDLLYVAYNRLEMTRESFTALVNNTSWANVSRLLIHDDGSTDGTAEWLREESRRVITEGTDVDFQSARLGGPVAAMMWALDQIFEPEGHSATWAKIDNDFVVCKGWLDEMLRVFHLAPELDILGVEPRFGPPVAGRALRGYTEAEFIGGKGLLRTRAFQYCRPKPRGRQGFTQWQTAHPEIRKGWVTPDLPCFGLDQVPLEPWRSLTVEYEERGWARRWPEYDGLQDGYWSWWKPAHLKAAA